MPFKDIFVPRYSHAALNEIHQDLVNYVTVVITARPSITNSVELYASEASVLLGVQAQSAQRWFRKLGLERLMGADQAFARINAYFGTPLTCNMTARDLCEHSNWQCEMRQLRMASHMKALGTYLDRIEQARAHRAKTRRTTQEQ